MASLGKKIKDLRISLGLKQHELGTRIGAPQGTVSKWEKGAQSPSIEYAASLAQLAGVPIEHFVDSSSRPTAVPPLGRHTPVIGAVQAGAWNEAVEWDKDTWYYFPARTKPEYDGVPIYGLEVVGESFNKVYPDETIVFVVPIKHWKGPVPSGEVVVALRRDADGSYETTLKEYVIDENGKKWLWPHSSMPEFQTPIPFSGSRSRTSEISIMGVVVASYLTSMPRR